jgi:transposase
MQVTYTYCAGLDIHKKTVVACASVPDPQGQPQTIIRTFSTMTADLLALGDWLHSLAVTAVAMESTGEFWKPVYNLLEGQFELLVVNAQHIKNVPGRKTDVKDAEWLADLLRHGLLHSSFIPPRSQRDLRDLTRQRTNLVQDRATVVNRLQKALEWANLKLSAVVSDVTGVSARAMLAAIVAGETAPAELAELARGRLRAKRDLLEQALTGRVREHHRFIIAEHLIQFDNLDEQIGRFDAQISAYLDQVSAPPPAAAGASDAAPASSPPAADPASPAPAAEPPSPAPAALTWNAALVLADAVPGIGLRLAQDILAETGIDMTRFPSAAHFASWAKLCPGHNESAGKRFSGATGHGNRWLRTKLVQAAWAAVKVRDSYFAACFHRLAGRRGVKRAIIAVAHRILIALYHVLAKQEAFRDLGATYYDARSQAQLIKRTERRFAQLGLKVTVEPWPPAA